MQIASATKSRVVVNEDGVSIVAGVPTSAPPSEANREHPVNQAMRMRLGNLKDRSAVGTAARPSAYHPARRFMALSGSCLASWSLRIDSTRFESRQVEQLGLR